MTSTLSAALLICLVSLGSVPPASAAPAAQLLLAATAEQKSAPANKTVQSKKKAPVKKKAAVKKRPPIASKSKSAREVARTKLAPVQLDLSLPQEMVRHLQPLGTMPQPKNTPLLPPMFSEKPLDNSAFEINGRLLSNEMQLQMRNDERRDVEGAALDFEFRN